MDLQYLGRGEAFELADGGCPARTFIHADRKAVIISEKRCVSPIVWCIKEPKEFLILGVDGSSILLSVKTFNDNHETFSAAVSLSVPVGGIGVR